MIKKRPTELNFKDLGLDKIGIQTVEDFKKYLKTTLTQLQKNIANNLNVLLSDLLNLKQSRYTIEKTADHTYIRLPGLTVIERGAFVYVSTFFFTYLESTNGEFISLPFLKLIDTPKGEIVKLPFLTVMDFNEKGEIVNILGISIKDLHLAPNETANDLLAEIIGSLRLDAGAFNQTTRYKGKKYTHKHKKHKSKHAAKPYTKQYTFQKSFKISIGSGKKKNEIQS